MKKLLGIVVLGLLLSGNAYAEDIGDFQIEEISVGDSALDHFEKKELKKEKNEFKSKKYNKYCSSKFETYEGGICFYTKRKDKLFIIESIAGFQSYPDDIEACYVEQVNIDKELSSLFNNAKRQVDDYKIDGDKTGKSTERDIIYVLQDGGEVGTACLDYSKKFTKKNNANDHLQVFVDTKEYANWLRTEAW